MVSSVFLLEIFGVSSVDPDKENVLKCIKWNTIRKLTIMFSLQTIECTCEIENVRDLLAANQGPNGEGGGWGAVTGALEP